MIAHHIIKVFLVASLLLPAVIASHPFYKYGKQKYDNHYGKNLRRQTFEKTHENATKNVTALGKAYNQGNMNVGQAHRYASSVLKFDDGLRNHGHPSLAAEHRQVYTDVRSEAERRMNRH